MHLGASRLTTAGPTPTAPARAVRRPKRRCGPPRSARERTAARRPREPSEREFHGRAWVSGTGGGICGPTEDGNLFLAPTAVHKERVEPRDFFVVSPQDGRVIRPAEDTALRPSECNAIFGLVARKRAARSVVHSHGLVAVRAGDIATGGELAIADLEMLKGIRGLTNSDVHRVPVIANTPHESELVSTIADALAEPRFAATFAVLVRDHGAYIWGDDVWEAKRHTEVYHFLFEAVLARHPRFEEGTR